MQNFVKLFILCSSFFTIVNGVLRGTGTFYRRMPSDPCLSLSGFKCEEERGGYAYDMNGCIHERSGACGCGLQFGNYYTAAVSEAIFRSHSACGDCYKLCTGGKCIKVKVDDLCPPWNGNSPCTGNAKHFDISSNAYAELSPSSGYFDLTYESISCSSWCGPTDPYEPPRSQCSGPCKKNNLNNK